LNSEKFPKIRGNLELNDTFSLFSRIFAAESHFFGATRVFPTYLCRDWGLKSKTLWSKQSTITACKSNGGIQDGQSPIFYTMSDRMKIKVRFSVLARGNTLRYCDTKIGIAPRRWKHFRLRFSFVK